MQVPLLLPNACGPRMPHFCETLEHDHEPCIELLQVIGSGLHAHVIKAKIDGREYAIKIFKFTHKIGFHHLIGDRHRPPPYAQLQAQCEPFNRECRVFARLKELGKEHLAVRCYGYLIFDAAMERDLAEKLGLVDWGRDPKASPEFEGRPLQALVKELLPESSFAARDAPALIDNLKEIHRCGIVVMDIKLDAYVGKTLVDFSYAATVPHINFDDRFEFNKRNDWSGTGDLDALDATFEFWNDVHKTGPKIWLRAYCSRYWLRHQDQRHIDDDLYDLSVKNFDWRGSANEWTKLPRESMRVQDLSRKREAEAETRESSHENKQENWRKKVKRLSR